MNPLIQRTINKPKAFVWLAIALALLTMSMAIAPTLSESVAKYLHPLKIDADPENMLAYDDPARSFHRDNRYVFSLYDIIVIGIVNDTETNGVFNRRSLSNIYDLVNFAKSIQWENNDGNREGVISADLISPSNVDYIEQNGPGTIIFDERDLVAGAAPRPWPPGAASPGPRRGRARLSTGRIGRRGRSPRG